MYLQLKSLYLDIHQLYGTDVVQDYETNVPMFGDIRTANTPPPTPTTSSTTTTTTTTTTTSSAQAGLLSTMKKTWNIPKTQKMKMLLNFAQYLKQTGWKIGGFSFGISLKYLVPHSFSKFYFQLNTSFPLNVGVVCKTSSSEDCSLFRRYWFISPGYICTS